MKESKFQRQLIDALTVRFPGCLILKNDANYIQGIPDLLLLYKEHWAMLECKQSAKSARRPNQEYYVKILNEMSFASFVYPENMEEVLDAIQRSFKAQGPTCVP